MKIKVAQMRHWYHKYPRKTIRHTWLDNSSNPRLTPS